MGAFLFVIWDVHMRIIGNCGKMILDYNFINMGLSPGFF